VTCPTFRTHPAIIAQAAATVATMMPGRFFLGLGSGENLNEHIIGRRWPETEVRQEMLIEAIKVIRLLWEGGNQSHHGRYYTVENARIYSLPGEPPPIYVAAGGSKSAELAREHADGLIGTEPDKETIEQFRKGDNKPCFGEVTVCFDPSEKQAKKTLKEVWPVAGVPGALMWELPLPAHFEKVSELVTEEQLKMIPCGPEPEKYVQVIKKYIEAGYDHVCLHQVGPAQEEFLEFASRELLPRLQPRKAKREAKIA
jgi:G6PDH family F420-dependent oxidoreductase